MQLAIAVGIVIVVCNKKLIQKVQVAKCVHVVSFFINER